MNLQIQVNQIPINIVLEKDWGSQNPVGRLMLHKTRKDSTGVHLSTSHCEGIGAFAQSEDTSIAGIGIDLELAGRAQAAVLKRVLNSKAVNIASMSPTVLWCGLESAFKAFRFLSPKVLSEIELTHIQPEESQNYQLHWVYKNHKCVTLCTKYDTQFELAVSVALK